MSLNKETQCFKETGNIGSVNGNKFYSLNFEIFFVLFITIYKFEA